MKSRWWTACCKLKATITLSAPVLPFEFAAVPYNPTPGQLLAASVNRGGEFSIPLVTRRGTQDEDTWKRKSLGLELVKHPWLSREST